MFRKILNISLKVVAAIFVFYLFLGFVLIPLGLTWAIKDQGTKFLKHPVSAKTVQFNPFLWRLDIYGLEIKDAQGQDLAGFGRLGVDISFLSILKKEYRVESVVLDGLKLNVVMSTGGHINLLDLVPQASQPTAGGKDSAVNAPAAGIPPLPVVIIDDISFKNGGIRFVDKTIQPQFTTTLSGMTVHVIGLSTRPESVATVNFETKMDEKGLISMEAHLKPLAQPLELDATLALSSYALDALTPYTGKYTGRELKDGKLDFKMTYRLSENKLTASHKVLIQRFEFGKKVESKDALGLPFGLAVALLEDSQGRINISLPVTGDMSKPDFHFWSLVGQMVRNFFMGLVTKPFSFLGSMLGAESGTEDLGYVRFLPGKADLLDEEKAKMTMLVKGLKERPKILLEVGGNYDPQMDWKAIKTEALAREYKELRRQSSKSDSVVYQMIYQRHFGIKDLWALTNKFKTREGEYKEDMLAEEIKRQLIENTPPDKTALDTLAASRAKVVNEFILASGFDPKRVSLGGNRETQGSVGFVPLEFTLTVFDDTKKEDASSQDEEKK